MVRIGKFVSWLLISLVAVFTFPAWTWHKSQTGLSGFTRSAERITFTAGNYPLLSMPSGTRRAIQSVLNVDHKMHFGDYVWDVKDVPIGIVWVRVDLSQQTLSIFRANQEIGTSVILYGTDGKPTPTGLFPVLERQAQHQSSLYDASMPYMLRLTNDGVAIHASNVREGSATHGCVGVPIGFAKLMFSQVKRGDLVAIVS